ncbi:hypothetical protein JNW90_24255 [Micromonospora sp. STR1s_5]|nr:hypothetical protein [Micromonospora sp. STR1s_5]
MSETTATQPTTAVTFRPRGLYSPARKDVVRTFSRNGLVKVESRHPQYGLLYRGRIRHLPIDPADGGLGRWEITDLDHTNLGVVVGDYVDAEDTLLEATCELDADAPTTANKEEDDPWTIY